MAKTKISEFSATPANNTDIDNINIAEGCAPSGINNAIRELMAQLKEFQAGTAGDSFNGPIGTSTAAAGAFTTLSASGAFTYGGVTLSNAVTGTGNMVLSASPTLVTPTLGTPASVTLTNATGLPISTGVSGLGTGVATFLATPSSANLAAAVSDETGTGALVFANSPTFVNPALGTPASGTVTNLTGTASININGTVGATTANTGAFTTLAASGAVTLSAGTANGVAYLNGSKVLTTGSALQFQNGNFIIGSATDSGSKLQVGAASGSTSTPTAIELDGTYGTSTFNGLKFYLYKGASESYGLGLGGASDLQYWAGSSSTGVHRFFTNQTEQMRLTSTGLGIGTTNTSNGKLNVQAGTGATGNSGFFTNLDGTNNPYVQIQHSSTGTKLFASSSAGGAASNLTLSTPGGDLLLNSSGNLGLGVTPSAWGSGSKAIQIGLGGSVFGNTGLALSGLGCNVYNDGSNDKYISSTNASQYFQLAGGHYWFTAPSGTAGNAISFTQAMTLDASGRLLVGTTTAAGMLTVTAPASTTYGTLNAVSDGFGYLTMRNNGTDCGYVGPGASGSGNQMSIVSAGAIPLIFGTNNTERARIDSSGNLGIGTSSPLTGLTLSKSGTQWTNNSSNSYPVPSGRTFLQMEAQASQANWFGFTGSYGATSGSANLLLQVNLNNINQQAGNYIGSEATSSTTSVLTFGRMFGGATTGSNSYKFEDMRIDSSGRLLVGTTSLLNSAPTTVQVLAQSTASSAVVAVGPNGMTASLVTSQSVSAASTGWYAFIGQSGNGSSITANNFFVYGNGNVQNANNSYGAISDLKLKENIADVTPKLNKLCKVRVVNYNLKGDYEKHKQLGVIAQEIEQIFPGMVDETPDRDVETGELTGETTKSVKYSVFVPMLIKAMQEQQAIIESLTTRIATLESK